MNNNLDKSPGSLAPQVYMYVCEVMYIIVVQCSGIIQIFCTLTLTIIAFSVDVQYMYNFYTATVTHRHVI